MAASSRTGVRPGRLRGVAFVTTRGPEREFLALARAESFVLGGRTFTIVGGVAVDEAFSRGWPAIARSSCRCNTGWELLDGSSGTGRDATMPRSASSRFR